MKALIARMDQSASASEPCKKNAVKDAVNVLKNSEKLWRDKLEEYFRRYKK